MTDPYTVLGVRRDDKPETIRKAFLKLAKRHHPDMNPGKTDAAEKFKALNTANDILSDPDRRARYDRGELDDAGNEKAPQQRPYPRDGQESPFGQRGGFGGGHGMSAEEIEALLGAFGGRGGGPRRGEDQSFHLTVDFLDACNGAVRRLSLPGGKSLDVTIPAGMTDGQMPRLKGQGHPGQRGGPAGDALVEVSVASHPWFTRDGNDILLDLPVTLQEAVLGASVTVPTIKGSVRLTIPPHSANGAKLRLGKRGIAGGSQIVTLKLVLPAGPDAALDEFLQAWQPAAPVNPRAAMEAAS